MTIGITEIKLHESPSVRLASRSYQQNRLQANRTAHSSEPMRAPHKAAEHARGSHINSLSHGSATGTPATLASNFRSHDPEPFWLFAHNFSRGFREDQARLQRLEDTLPSPTTHHNTGRMKYIHSQELLDIPEGGT